MAASSDGIVAFLRAALLIAALLPGAAGAQTSQMTQPAPAISAADLQRQISRGGKLLLFDIREEAEFAVSRIKGAERLDAATETGAFVARRAGALRGATVVFYCTTGGRSAPYAELALDELLAAGATDVFTLKDGLIGWVNEGRPLVDAKGATPYLHPYQNDLTALLKRPDLARTEPRS